MAGGRDLPWSWGATPAEHERAYPADDLVPGGVLRMTRAVDVAAPPPLLYRWLCQVAVAPYSYDLVDNLGRRSPRELTPGADDLRLGQGMAVVFRLTGFEPGHQWTASTTPRGARLFGAVGITYAAEPVTDEAAASRLVCRLAVPDGGRAVRLRARALAWGDLVMMRKQLHTLRDLAERDARRG